MVYRFGESSPELIEPTSFLEKMDALGITKEQQEFLRKELQKALKKLNLKTELTNAKVEEAARILLGEKLLLPRQLEMALLKFSQGGMTNAELSELAEVFRQEVNATPFLLHESKLEVQNHLEKDLGEAFASLQTLGEILDDAIKANKLDDPMVRAAIDEVVKTDWENLLKAQFRPQVFAVLNERIQNLIKDLNRLKERHERWKDRQKMALAYDLAALSIRKIARFEEELKRAQNRTDFRARRAAETSGHRDNAARNAGERQVERALAKAERRVAAGENHGDRLDDKLDRRAARRRNWERWKENQAAKRAAAREKRFQGKLDLANERRDHYQKQIEVGGALRQAGQAARSEYREGVIDARNDYKSERLAIKSQKKLKKKYEKYRKKADKLEEKLRDKKAKWQAKLERQRGQSKGNQDRVKSAPDTQRKETAANRVPVGGRLASNFDNPFTPPIAEGMRELEDYKKWEGFKSPEEVHLMSDVHEDLARQFLNPAFMLFIKGREEAVDSVFLEAANHPYDLKYVEVEDGVVEVKKDPGAQNNESIPDNFLIRIEKGDVVQVRSGKIHEVLEAKNPRDPLPWIGAGEYNRRINDYTERYSEAYWGRITDIATVEFEKLPEEDQASDKKWLEIFFRVLNENMNGQTKEIYDINNKLFIQKLKKLVDARDVALNGLEKNHPYYKVIESLAKKGQTAPEEIYVMYADAKQPDVYVIKDIEPPHGVLAAFSLEGYFMEKNAEGKWVASDLYDEAMETGYYRDNPEAKKTPESKEEVEESGDGGGEEAEEEVEEDAELKFKAINSFIDAANDQELKEILFLMDPKTKGNETYLNQWDANFAQGVKDWMHKELSTNKEKYLPILDKLMDLI